MVFTELIAAPIIVKCAEGIINYLLTNKPETRESNEITELRNEVELLKTKLGQQITADQSLSVQKAFEDVYMLIEEYDIDLPDIEYNINYEACTGCGLCQEICPTEAIILNDYNEIERIDLDYCIGCGLCEIVCADEAIELSFPDIYGEVDFLPSAEIKNVWVEHNNFEDNLKGMHIHLNFDINNLERMICRAVAYFYYETGKPLRDYNQKYFTTDGKVSSSINFTPIYINTSFSDLQIFMPYDELHIIKKGKFELKFFVSIWYENTELASSGWESFIYNVS